MAADLAPVAIHMWFADGEGWSYDRFYSEPGRLLKLIDILDDVLKAVLADHGGEIQFCRQGLDGWFIGMRLPDNATVNRHAVSRSPSILRVAYCKSRHKPSAELVASVVRKMTDLMPANRGPLDLAISVEIHDKPAPPPLAKPVATVVPSDRRLATASWKELTSQWRDAVEASTLEPGFLSEQFLMESPDGSIVTRDHVLNGKRRPTGVVDIGHAATINLRSDGRVLVAGPVICPPGYEKAPNEYAVHVFETTDVRATVLLSRHFDANPMPTGGWLSRLLSSRKGNGASPEQVGRKIKEMWSKFERSQVERAAVTATSDTTSEDCWLLALAWMIPFRATRV